jgi:MtrB/PioB family decaheme-associated outer membrane protein
MKIFSSLFLLAALGALTAGPSAAAVDTSQWKCETCPFEKAGVSGSVDVGVIATSEESARFGDASGLKRKGAYLLADGQLRWRGEGGYSGELSAANLGLDSRQLSTQAGVEGRYALNFGYAELPHYLSTGARTPYLGVGSAQLDLPAGFAAPTTAGMPLAGTLQPVDIGFKRTRVDLGGSVGTGSDWRVDLKLRRDVRDGTQRSAGSFFSSAAQLVAPLDQETDQVEVAASYRGARVQARLAYHVSVFRNADEALTWANPFSVGPGRGQLALAPDNQFHQLSAALGYEITPRVRASADVAVGRMTQDAAYVAATQNPQLTVPALPAASLDGRVNTLNASLRVSAAVTEALRLNASYTRDERDNDTVSQAWPAVSTDLFLAAAPRINQPYGFTQDRFRLGADLRGPGSLRLAFGAQHDSIERTLQSVATTREASVWGRVTLQPLQDMTLALKLAHADRNASGYEPVAALDPAENPLMRKYNQADRRRDSGGLRVDYIASEKISIGLSADMAYDDYQNSSIGLTSGHSVNAGVDLAWAVSDETQVQVYLQEERMTSRQAGSTLYARPDWRGLSRDTVDVFGIGVKQMMLDGKLELGAQLSTSRSRSSTAVDTGASSPAFPNASTARDSFKLQATWQMSKQLSLIGSWWYERYTAKDWHLDGVDVATVPNLLALGERAPNDHVNLLRVGIRYRY